MQRRTLLTLLPAAVLAGCGFRLRGVPEFAFSSLYIAAPTGSSLARELQRTLDGSGSQLKVLRNAADLPTAQVVIDILSEQRDRVVVGQNASGQVREVQLRLRVKFRLRTQGSVELIPETEIQQQRDMTYSETQALSKEPKKPCSTATCRPTSCSNCCAACRLPSCRSDGAEHRVLRKMCP
jgi:LPS-assembly lipoprotein